MSEDHNGDGLWDVFISYASEDKDEIAEPLAETLKSKGLRVWYDEFIIKPGDSISDSISKGLKKSTFGLIILSKNFFRKNWTRHEYNVLIKRAVDSSKRILIPIWHRIDLSEVRDFSEPLADIKALKSSIGMDKLSDELINLIKHSSVETGSLESRDVGRLSNFLKEIYTLFRKGQAIPISELKKLCFVVLSEIYSNSKASKHTFIPFDVLYNLLPNDEVGRQAMDNCYRSLRKEKLLDSKALGTLSITHYGIKEIEKTIVKPGTSVHFQPQAYELMSDEKKVQIEEIIRMRKAFLYEARNHSKGANLQVLNAFEIIQSLGYDKETLNSIYWYLEDEDLIETFAMGGDFTIAHKGSDYFATDDTM